jgi:hypothetical protein
VTARSAAHATASEILDRHFGEAGPSSAAAVDAHVERCAACRTDAEAIAWAEALVGPDPVAAPPADGLQRVLSRVAREPRPVPRRLWLRAALPSAAVVAAGAVAIHLAGARVLASGLVPEAVLAPLAALTGFGLAAAAFFAAGSLFTLAVVPVLILEAQAARRAASR